MGGINTSFPISFLLSCLVAFHLKDSNVACHDARSRISELSRVVESSESEKQYTRPEFESRIDSVARDLEDLRLHMQKLLANPNASTSAALTETDVRELTTRLASLTDSENTLLADKIVSSLNYDSRPVRLESVPQAHKDTFQWAFDSQLSEWFRSGSGTFWISGKPGSGKSTFMKFISKHPRTKELLAAWAGSSDNLAVAAHFFWIAGTSIQKSWQGLLQSLLFDLLRGRPYLASLISPNRWAAAKAGQWHTAAEPWSVPELATALRALATADHVPLKICFLSTGSTNMIAITLSFARSFVTWPVLLISRCACPAVGGLCLREASVALARRAWIFTS